MPRTNGPGGKPAVREPKQARGIKTKERLIEAGRKLFSEIGFHEATIEGIVREAGTAVGSFYAYFRDKRDLFMSVTEQYAGEAGRVLQEGMEELNTRSDLFPGELVLNTVAVLLAAHKRSPGLLKETMRMSLHDDGVKALIDSYEARAIRLIEEAFTRISGAGAAPERGRVLAYVLFYAADGVIHRLVLSEGDVDEGSALKELAVLFTHFIDREIRRG